MFFYFENDGPELLSTNYWESEHAGKGFVHVTINAGCLRLLVPKGKGISIDEMRTAEVVLITRGPWKEQGKHDGLEVLFEDNSNSPYCLHLAPEQVALFPKDSDRDRPGQEPKWTFAVYNEDGKQFECKARFRKAKAIPYMKAWRD